MSSKLERLVFSGREDDFLYFAEQFEARMLSLKLGKILSGEATYLDYVPAVRNNSSEEQRRQAIEKGREELGEKKKTLWYELVQALDKTSVLFLDHISVMALELGMYCVNASKVLRDPSYTK